MGIYNKITEEKYCEIKKAVRWPADDKKAMKKFGIGKTSCRNIRNSANYRDYLQKTVKNRKRPQIKYRPSKVEGVSWEDKPIYTVVMVTMVIIAVLMIGFIIWVATSFISFLRLFFG